AFFREARRLCLGTGSRLRFAPELFLARLALARRLQRLRLELRALARVFLGGFLRRASFFGERRGARVPGQARLGLLERRLLGCAPHLLLGGLLVARRLEPASLGLYALAHRAARLLFRRRAFAHRRARLHLRLGAFARVRRRFLFLLPSLLGERRGLFLRLLAALRLGERLRFGALALGHQTRRLGFGLGARMRHAPQLDLGRLALAREIEAALLLGDARARHLLAGFLALDALALGVLQLIVELAH